MLYGFEGKLVWPEGTPFELPEIDDAFGGDGSFRWLSDLIRFAEASPRQHPQRRVLERLRLIDLYFRIKHPERARLPHAAARHNRLRRVSSCPYR